MDNIEFVKRAIEAGDFDEDVCQQAQELTKQLKTARGKRYYEILRCLRHCLSDDLSKDFLEIKKYYGKITPVTIGVLALHYDINLKAMFELLNDCHLIKCGHYDRIIIDGKVKVGEIFEAAKQLKDCPVSINSRYESGVTQ